MVYRGRPELIPWNSKGQVLVNAVLGQVETTEKQMSGYPTSQAQPTIAWYKSISQMLRSHSSNVFVLKYYAPLILFGGTFVFWSVGFRWAQLVILVPLFVGVFFYASLAVLEIPDVTVRYRRLLRWTRVPYEEIVESGTSWAIFGIGYLRLKHSVFPWGKLYFVLDQNEKLFGRGAYPLLRHIQKHAAGQRSEAL